MVPRRRATELSPPLGRPDGTGERFTHSPGSVPLDDVGTAPDLQIHDRGPRHRVAALGDTMIQVWCGAIPMAAIVATGRSHQRIREAGHDKVAVLAFTEGGMELPSAAVRKASAELMKKNRPELACNSVVVPGGGSWASAARSALTGIFLVGSGGVPSRVFGDIPAAVTWHCGYAESTTPVALAPAVQRLREELVG